MQSAVGWEYQTELSKHGSQKDAAKGFGGKYGIEKDKQDKVSSIVYVCNWNVACHTVVMVTKFDKTGSCLGK